MVVAVENTGPGAAPVQLVVLDGTKADLVYDINTPASVIAAHLSPDAPAVDLLADVVGSGGEAIGPATGLHAHTRESPGSRLPGTFPVLWCVP